MREHLARAMRAVGFTAHRACMTVLFIALPPAALAQPSTQASPTWSAPEWVKDVTFLSTSTLLGGLAGGLMREFRGGSFRDGFARGALGGAVVYGGRRLAVAGFDGSGIAGRQLSALGTSMIRNAGEGHGTFERLMFPIGPVHLYVVPDGPARFTAKLNAHTFAWMASAVVTPGLELDTRASLLGGAPIFRSTGRGLRSEGGEVGGIAIGGVILVSDDAHHYGTNPIIRHELVHVLQNDFNFRVWGGVAESALLSRTRAGRYLNRFVDLDVVGPLTMEGLSTIIPYHQRPWEIEAAFLERR